MQSATGSSSQGSSSPGSEAYQPLTLGSAQKQRPADAIGIEEEDGLDELTALCLTSSDLPQATTTAAACDALPSSLDKTDTSDSAQMADFLHMLQGSCGQKSQTRHTSALGCKDDILGLGPVGIMVVDNEADDVSLTSTRRHPILDFFNQKAPLMGGVSTSSASVVLPGQSIQHGSPEWVLCPTVSGVPASCGPNFGSVGPNISDAITATTSYESASTLPYGSASGSVASVPSVVSASSPLSASVVSGASLLYIAVFLTRESREVLLSMVPAVHALLRADHMTLAYRPTASQLLDLPLGAEVELQVLGTAADSRVQAVFVSPPGWLQPTTSVSTHVTISMAVGAQAVEAGHLIKDALQQAALLDFSCPIPAQGAGSYQHFDEPLPLVGRVGVRLAVPAATAAALGKAGGLDLDVVQQDLGSGNCELVVYSVDDLIRSGIVSIGSDALEYYYSKHAGALGKQLPPSYSSSPFTSQALPYSVDSQATTLSPSAASVSPLQLSPALTPPEANHWSFSAAEGAAAGPAAVDITLVPDSPHSSSGSSHDSSDSGGSADSGSSEAVQFLSAVHVGDYVAVRPIVPTEGNERRLQGYVCEFACDEPFQANGVLAVLTDNTIGYVVAVLDSAAAGGQASGSGSSNSSATKASLRSKRPAGSKPSRTSRSSKAAKGAAVAYPVDPGCSSNKAAGAEVAADSCDPFTGMILAADGAAAAAAEGGKRRSARDAERDLQLWKDFDALQHKHGEALCNSILESCNKDFAEAIALIQAQASTLQAATAAAAGSPAAVTAVHGNFDSSADSAAAATAPAADEELVQQLALSLGLSADSAVRLARLVPDMPADRVVAQLQQEQGDINKAADALLAGGEPAASSSQHTGNSSPAVASASAADDVTPCPAGRAASAFMAAKDPNVAVGAKQLCDMCPGLQLELAELLLQEHGGNVGQAARALSDMQASELEARTAAAAGSPLHTAAAAEAVQAGPPSAAAAEELSEADQLAILAAMGELDIDMQPQLQRAASPKRPAAAAAAATASPPPPYAFSAAAATTTTPPGPEFYYQAPGQPRLSPQLRSQTPLSQPPPPPPPPPSAQPLPPPSSIYLTDMETKRAAKEAADALYTKAKSLNAAAEVFVTVAQDLLAQGDKAGYKEKLERAKQARDEAKAAIEEAQRVSWAANNKRSNCWEIDLHGLGATKALKKFEQQFSALQMLDHPGGVLFRVIVGQGHHSDNNVPKIKLGVLQYMHERSEGILAETGRPWGVTWEVDPSNPGIININIPCDDGVEG